MPWFNNDKNDPGDISQFPLIIFIIYIIVYIDRLVRNRSPAGGKG